MKPASVDLGGVTIYIYIYIYIYICIHSYVCIYIYIHIFVANFYLAVQITCREKSCRGCAVVAVVSSSPLLSQFWVRAPDPGLGIPACRGGGGGWVRV